MERTNAKSNIKLRSQEVRLVGGKGKAEAFTWGTMLTPLPQLHPLIFPKLYCLLIIKLTGTFPQIPDNINKGKSHAECTFCSLTLPVSAESFQSLLCI